MKTQIATILSIICTGVSLSAFAHDPSEHKKEAAAAADCAKMKDMDMSKMDVNDPVMKAMQKKCKNHMNHQAADHHHDDAKSATTATAKGVQQPASAGKQASDDCAKMKTMDMSKMNMKDPATKAMHEKCMQHMEHGDSKSAPANSNK